MIRIYNSNSNKEIVEYLQKYKLMYQEYKCPDCKILTKKYERDNRSDGGSWRCSKCRSYYSYREDSFFFLLKKELNIVIKLMYHWAIQTRVKDVSDITGVSGTTIVKYFKTIRELCIEDLNKSELKLGGLGRIVEIDESLFAKVKHYKGKDLQRKQVWVFGMKERGVKRGKFIA